MPTHNEKIDEYNKLKGEFNEFFDEHNILIDKSNSNKHMHLGLLKKFNN